jgi:CMP-N,N'-diacetyllegionaminic acid synthase
MELNKPIAIIPARGGSKRVLGKNIAEINGKPLVCYTIDVCLESGIFSEVYVNTDDSDICYVAEKCGAKSYRRPEEYATDTAYVVDAIKEMIRTLNLYEYNVGILLPTSPLRIVKDLQRAWMLFQNKHAPVVSVCKYETPVQLAHCINNDGRLESLFPDDYRKTTRSIGHKDSYRFNGGIVFNSASRLLEQSNLIGSNPYPYVMPEERSIDIDHPYQLEMIKMMINNRS